MSQPLPISTPEPAAPRGFVPFARGFRPFFLCAGLAGACLVPAWLAVLRAWLAPPAWGDPMRWHGHEMVFGFVAAAIAGFLLTSVPVWTGSAPVRGAALAALVALWAAGRAAMALAGSLPPWAVAAIDLAFLPALAAVVARPILAARARRNYGVAALLAALFLANAATHLAALGLAPGAGRVGLRVAVDLVVVLIVVIGGRITPAFTQNALLRADPPAAVRARPALDRLSVATAALVALLDAIAPRSTATGAAAALAAIALPARMAGGQTRRVLADPLLGSLHAGLAWVALGFGLVALGDLGAPVPPSAALHALTAGAMGSMILAVMTRVALGHTGRALRAPRAAVAAYALVHAGALVRVVGPLVAPARLADVWSLAGLLWAAAFAVFTARYAPILLRPRVDGQAD